MALDSTALLNAIADKLNLTDLTNEELVRARDNAISMVQRDLPTTEALPDDKSLFAGLVLLGSGLYLNPATTTSEIVTIGDPNYRDQFAPSDLIEAHSDYWKHLRVDGGIS